MIFPIRFYKETHLLTSQAVTDTNLKSEISYINNLMKVAIIYVIYGKQYNKFPVLV